MVDIDAIRASMIKRSRAVYSLIQSVQGSLDTVHLMYNADEGLTENQAIAQYLWTQVLPEVEPSLLTATDDFAVTLADGTLGGRPHSWFEIRDLNFPTYKIIIDPYFPGAFPQVITIDSSSPIIEQYQVTKHYPFGKGPDDD